ncbi:hypothetical protein EMPG_12843, partial [Blastomyces silverae]
HSTFTLPVLIENLFTWVLPRRLWCLVAGPFRLFGLGRIPFACSSPSPSQPHLFSSLLSIAPARIYLLLLLLLLHQHRFFPASACFVDFCPLRTGSQASQGVSPVPVGACCCS